MHFKKILSTFVVLGCLFALPQTFAEEPRMAPNGFVRFSQQGLGLILGGSTGGGWIHFDGDDHTFRIAGVSFGALGGIGETRMSGEVYGMKTLADFAGTYTKSTAGISAVVGGGGVWLENDHGVKMHLKAESTGIGINISVGTVKVKLGMVD